MHISKYVDGAFKDIGLKAADAKNPTANVKLQSAVAQSPKLRNEKPRTTILLIDPIIIHKPTRMPIAPQVYGEPGMRFRISYVWECQRSLPLSTMRIPLSAAQAPSERVTKIAAIFVSTLLG